MVSMMRVPLVNCRRAMLRTRRTSLRRKKIAGGATIKLPERHDRILRHHHDNEPDQRHQIAADGGDEKVEHRRRRVAPVVIRAMNSGRMPVGEEAIFWCSSLSNMRR